MRGRWFTRMALFALCILLAAPAAIAAPPAKGTVQGTVTASGTGTPIAGASVLFESYSSKSGTYSAVATVTTNASGAYTYAAAAGTYRITYSAAGYFSQQRSQTVAAGTTYTSNVALALKTGTVRGAVTDSATGLPISGATVQVAKEVSAGTYSVVASLATTASGGYTYTGASGNYRLVFSTPGYINQTRFLTVGEGVTTTLNCALALVPAPGTISGTVTDSLSGLPVVGASVQIASQVSTSTYNVVATLNTDSNGAYSYSAAPGNYRLVFTAAGFLTDTQYLSVSSGGAYVRDSQLVPAP